MTDSNISKVYSTLDIQNFKEEIVRLEGIVSQQHNSQQSNSQQNNLTESPLHSETEFQSIWDVANDGMLTVDIKGLITLANPSAERLFGYEKNELVGQAIEVLVPASFRKSHVSLRQGYQSDPYQRKMSEGTSLELYGVKKDASQFPLEVSLSPITISGGKGILLNIHDVSTRKKLEDQLRQSQKLEAVGRLASGIVHDLNNILTVVMGFTELTERNLGKSHECTANLHEVSKASERAKLLISKVMSFTRQQVSEPRLINVADVVKDMRSMLLQLTKKNSTLIMRLNSDAHRVSVDPVQLEQIVVNLVVNASDAMAEGGEIIISTEEIELDKDFVRLHSLSSQGHYIELSISDTGMGMHKDLCEKIFEPFFSTKKLGKGTGLGLATVHNIVKQSNGEIIVYSEPGLGSTFKIYFPVADSRFTKNTHNSSATPVSQGSGRVLLVEDDEGVRNLAKRILSDNGYTVFAVRSAEEALGLLKTHAEIDLVISDVVLPGMNGDELSEAIKQLQPALPVILMSGFAGSAIGFIKELDDSSRFIAKPFSSKQLLQKVSSLI